MTSSGPPPELAAVPSPAMSGSTGPDLVNPFAGVADVGRLRAAADALTAVAGDLNQDWALTSLQTGPESPRIAAIREITEVVVRRRNWAVAQLAGLRHEMRRHGPMVLDPALLPDPMAAPRPGTGGSSVLPVVTAAATSAGGMSTGHVWMPPQRHGPACVHQHTSVVVLVLFGRALTVWWDDHGTLHELPQESGQHLFMPPGVPYGVLNPHPMPLVAVICRDNPVFDADTETRPDLTPYLRDRCGA